MQWKQNGQFADSAPAFVSELNNIPNKILKNRSKEESEEVIKESFEEIRNRLTWIPHPFWKLHLFNL